MAHAKIVAADGMSIEIEGTPDEVSAVVQKLRGDRAQSISPVSTGTVRKKQGKTQIPDLIESLRSEDFFGEPKGLKQVRAKLAEAGHHYPLTTLSGAMQAEARSRRLRRFKEKGKYVYVQ